MAEIMLVAGLVLALGYGYWLMGRLNDYLNSDKIQSDYDDEEEEPRMLHNGICRIRAWFDGQSLQALFKNGRIL